MSGSADKTYAGLSYEQVVRKYADTVTGVCIMRLENYVTNAPPSDAKTAALSPSTRRQSRRWRSTTKRTTCHGR